MYNIMFEEEKKQEERGKTKRERPRDFIDTRNIVARRRMKYCGVSSSIIIVSVMVIFGHVRSNMCEAASAGHCVMKNETAIECECNEDNDNKKEELSMSMNYSKSTSLRVIRCAGAKIDFSKFDGSDKMRDIVVENISEYLLIGRFGQRMNLGNFKLVGINKISVIGHETFVGSTRIENFHIQDARISMFEEQLTNINVTRLTMKNVTIDRMIGINLSDSRGESLTIHDSVIKNIETTLNFAFFTRIDIKNSVFGMEKPGHLSIEGISASVFNSVFTNLSINLVASSDITIGASCADGKSSLRLSSDRIDSFDNKLPTEIIYRRRGAVSGSKNSDASTISSSIVNNTVCIAGNCKCPKSTARYNYHQRSARPNFYLESLLLLLLLSLF